MPGRLSLSDDVRRLVVEHVDSIGALDLLIMVRDHSDRWWTVRQVCDALRCPPRWAAAHLERMAAGGLLEADGDGQRRYAYRARDARLRVAVDELAHAYSTRTAEVAKLIFSPAFRRRWDERARRPG